jgi:hypothetical protein
MKNRKGVAQMTFKEAVEATSDVATCYKQGLSAFGAYSNRIEVLDTMKLQGSVDIDLCTMTKYPNDNRWDYAFAYKGEVFFVEVHSANTSEVKTMLRKLQWLKDWLNLEAPEINKLKAKSAVPFVWIQSKNFQIPKSSPQYFAAKSKGLIPLRRLKLS